MTEDQDIQFPICPFCKAEMEIESVKTGNGCGEYDTDYFWVCECQNLGLNNQE